MVHQHNFMEYISTKKGLYVFCFKEGCSSPIGYSKNSKAKFTTSTFGSHNFQGILNQTQHTSEEGEGSISFMNEVSPNSSKKLATLKLNQCLVNKLVSHSSKKKRPFCPLFLFFYFFLLFQNHPPGKIMEKTLLTLKCSLKLSQGRHQISLKKITHDNKHEI